MLNESLFSYILILFPLTLLLYRHCVPLQQLYHDYYKNYAQLHFRHMYLQEYGSFLEVTEEFFSYPVIVVLYGNYNVT